MSVVFKLLIMNLNRHDTSKQMPERAGERGIKMHENAQKCIELHKNA
jgi:hypothetical protein